MTYCNNCGFGIGSQGHEDCCIKKSSTYTRNGNRINMRDIDFELEEEREVRHREQDESSRQEFFEQWGMTA